MELEKENPNKKSESDSNRIKFNLQLKSFCSVCNRFLLLWKLFTRTISTIIFLGALVYGFHCIFDRMFVFVVISVYLFLYSNDGSICSWYSSLHWILLVLSILIALDIVSSLSPLRSIVQRWLIVQINRLIIL